MKIKILLYFLGKYSNIFFREIDLFDFSSVLVWTFFFNFLAHCDLVHSKPNLNKDQLVNGRKNAGKTQPKICDNNPVWNEEFCFECKVPELAFLEFKVKHYQSRKESKRGKIVKYMVDHSQKISKFAEKPKVAVPASLGKKALARVDLLPGPPEYLDKNEELCKFCVPLTSILEGK